MTNDPPGPPEATPPSTGSSDNASRRDSNARLLLAECAPESPFRTPDWRWRLSEHMAAGNRPPRRAWADRWVRTAVRLRGAGNGPRPRRTRLYAALEDAHRIQYGDNPHTRWEIEARLLAGQDNAQVAERLGVGLNTIEAYARVFFDISERLEHSDYIALVVDPAWTRFKGGATLEVAVKRLAYELGPLAADPLVDYYGRHRAGATQGRSLITLDPQLERVIHRAVSVMRFPVNPSTALYWVRLSAFVRELERRAAERSAEPVSWPVVVSGELADVLSDLMAAAPAEATFGEFTSLWVLNALEPAPRDSIEPIQDLRGRVAAG